MTLSDLQAEGRIRSHKTSRREVEDLIRLVERDMEDARVQGVSIDRRFMIGYEAALTLCTIPLNAAGFKTEGAAHHWTTSRALPMTMGEALGDVAEYLDTCRVKRNLGTYDRGGGITESELDELLTAMVDLMPRVMAWLKANHPELLPSGRS